MIPSGLVFIVLIPTQALRSQVVLNCAFSGVFSSATLSAETGITGDDDDGDDLDALLNGE